MKCPICGEPIKQGEDGAMICFGYWKEVDDEDNEFDPVGEEFDVCYRCAAKVEEFVHQMKEGKWQRNQKS